MRVLIIGATGFIGRELMKELSDAGHQAVAVSRNIRFAREILGTETEISEWRGLSANTLAGYLSGADAIVNLAGESISSGRWTVKRKKKLLDSRIRNGHLLAEALRISKSKPKVLIQASAIGIYGTPVEVPADESYPAGKGFLAELTQDWEDAVSSAGSLVPRIIIIRTGLVLGKKDGLLKKMLLPFRFYSGAILGSGRQWMSWIHIRDEVRAIRFLIENENCAGPYNLTAPEPVSMNIFVSSIAKTIKRPAWLHVPAIFLKAALGEMAGETVLSSQNVYPAKLLKEGFKFNYPHLPDALRNLLIEG